jgi:hypothetical protein
MGQWKARVSLFGMVSLLLVFIMTAVFIINHVKPRSNFFSVILISIFCVMQFFPMIEAFMINGVFLRNAIFHIVVLLTGTAVLAAIRFKAMRAIRSKEKNN